jgi:hypothetical protein
VEVRAVSRGGSDGVTAGDVADRESMQELLSDVDRGLLPRALAQSGG